MPFLFETDGYCFMLVSAVFLLFGFLPLCATRGQCTINLLRSPCAYPRSKTAGYYDAKKNRRATLKVKIALPTNQERGEYKFIVS